MAVVVTSNTGCNVTTNDPQAIVKTNSESTTTPIQDFTLWVSGCSHMPADKLQGRSAVTHSMAQIDAELPYDAALMLGDFESDQDPPTFAGNQAEGLDCVAQLSSSVVYNRSHIYTLAGNHDGGNAEMDWFNGYIDPIGLNTISSGVDRNAMPYPITLMGVDTWHSYYFDVGNVRFLMISDRNELPTDWGRGGTPVSGGYPSGTMTKESWEWCKSLFENEPNHNYIVNTHANPRFTTIATPDGDRACGDHGASGIAAGSGSLYSIYDEDLGTADDATDQFLDYFANNPNHPVVMWWAAHTHNLLDAACGQGSRTIHFNQSNVEFLNIAQLSRFHSAPVSLDPHSWVINIDNDRINMRMWCHNVVNTDPNQGIGYRPQEEFNISLKY